MRMDPILIILNTLVIRVTVGLGLAAMDIQVKVHHTNRNHHLDLLTIPLVQIMAVGLNILNRMALLDHLDHLDQIQCIASLAQKAQVVLVATLLVPVRTAWASILPIADHPRACTEPIQTQTGDTTTLQENQIPAPRPPTAFQTEWSGAHPRLLANLLS